MKIVSKKFKISSTHFLHFGRGIGPVEMELKQMIPQYIKDIGNWKPDTQDECYSANMPTKIMKVMKRAYEKTKSTATQGLYINLLNNFEDSFFHSLSDARFK